MANDHEGMSNDELMLAYAAGDAAAFDALYARNEALLWRFVRRLLGKRLAPQADEIFHEAWLRIITERQRFSPRTGSWRAWALTFAHGATMDRLRLAGLEVSLEPGVDTGEDIDWLAPALDAAGPAPDDEPYWSGAGRQLVECLESLPAPQRALFLLHHEDGASIEDLAARLDLRFETARSRLRHALQNLRGCMGTWLEPRSAE
jgi:RNA polymerase sigma-70 factor (ECF subfamily)